MKKRILSTALALLMCLSMLPTTAFAAEENDANGDGYHDGDVAVINGLIENNGLNWVKDDIENWSGISWGREKYRVEGLYLSDLSRTLLGELDVSALTALTVLHCTHEDITALDVSGNTALTRLLLTGTDITELDISKNAALTELKCDATPLLTITVPSSYKVGETMQSDEALNYALPTPRRVNYIFNGWYTAPTGGKRVEVGDTFDVVTTLYSQWSNGSIPEVTNYTVSFDSDGGSAVTAQTVAEGGKVTKPADPTKVKHVFDGWYGAYGVAGEDVFNDVYKWDFDTDTVTGDITLYAKWDAKDYAVEFNSEGGSAVASQYVDDGGKLVKPADPTKSGHTFGGWYKDKIITDTYTLDIDTADIFNDVYKWDFDTDVVEGDFTLHAKWTKKAGGGSSSSDSGSVTTPEEPKEDGKKEEETPAPSVTFSDVPSDAYYADAVAWAVEKGITNGVGEGSFAPEASCTRGQMVTFLYRMAGEPTTNGIVNFSDVSADSYYADAIAWAVEKGITNGTGDGLFSPDAECTRAQMAVFLYRMVGGSAAGASSFGDVDAGAYYADAVAWAAANGITTGTGDGNFSPNANCTRAQMVTFLYRCFTE